jgi:nitrite reductase/ring-hydroxylating ferredoxin subunit
MEMSRILSKWPFLKERIKHGFDNHKVECYHHGVRIEMKTGAVLIWLRLEREEEEEEKGLKNM